MRGCRLGMPGVSTALALAKQTCSPRAAYTRSYEQVKLDMALLFSDESPVSSSLHHFLCLNDRRRTPDHHCITSYTLGCCCPIYSTPPVPPLILQLAVKLISRYISSLPLFHLHFFQTNIAASRINWKRYRLISLVNTALVLRLHCGRGWQC